MKSETAKRKISYCVSSVYLEAVEESTDESKEPDKIGDAPMAGIQEWKLSEGVLGSCRKRYSRAHNNEHETRSSRIF